jgi:Domain of unknown function (DUF5078)
VLRQASIAITALGCAATALPGTASADATDDYPIPNRILKTTCTAEQIMAAARDTDPVYYERYMIDYNNKSPQIQQATRDKMHRFFAMDYARRRPHSEETGHQLRRSVDSGGAEPREAVLQQQPVAAHTTEVCAKYPPNDQSVWNW